MTDISNVQNDDYIVKAGEMGLESTLDLLDMGIPKEGSWIISPGETTSAREAALKVADQIERGGIADDARKPVADILRFLAQFASARPIPMT
ncbi:hypothetical protein U8C31_18230 [Sinorhizobium medicae]|uniref:hypothetical protein n=1 Tax=Sinorhizobium medicae TaxID=110321 RepID=UPI002AF6BEE7|nr:hypothetical protein [Sinorhizobium medicae]WQO72175.1 hypothetical protein U8C31_18230 [Sinorhizobium medicae]